MKKSVTLLDYSENFSCRSGSFWPDKTRVRRNSLGQDTTDFDPNYPIVEFEKEVIDYINDNEPPSYGISSEYSIRSKLLLLFLKKGGKLRNPQVFYDFISKQSDLLGVPGRRAMFSSKRKDICDIFYCYVKNSIKKRPPSEVEDKFFSFASSGNNYYGQKVLYKYAKYVIKGRLPEEVENKIAQLDYIGFVSSKGYDITNLLINNSQLSFYFYKKYHYLPEEAHNYMIALKLVKDKYATYYFELQKKENKIIRGRLKSISPSKTVKEVLESLS